MGCVSSSATSDSTNPPTRTSGSSRTAASNTLELRPTQQQGGRQSGVLLAAPVEAPPRMSFASQAELDTSREEFWSSRVDGDETVWMTLRRAAEASINNDQQLCSVLLMAAGINSPSGTLELTYDERGHEYAVPLYCYTASTDLIESKSTPRSEDTMSLAVEATKGPPGAPIRLKIKINPGDHTFILDTFENDSIALLKQRIFDKTTELAANVKPGTSGPPVCPVARQRIMLMGKELKNMKQRVVDAKMNETQVVQVFMKPANANASTAK